jgi:hypothetical protein
MAGTGGAGGLFGETRHAGRETKVFRLLPIVASVGGYLVLAGGAPAEVVTIDGGPVPSPGGLAADPGKPQDELIDVVVGTNRRLVLRPEAIPNQLSELPPAAPADPNSAASNAAVVPSFVPSFVQQLQQLVDPRR